MKTKIRDLLLPCSECGSEADCWETAFYGSLFPEVCIECSQCGRKTRYFKSVKTAIRQWNTGKANPKREINGEMDNDAIIDLMSQVLRRANDDYQLYSAVRWPTRADQKRAQEIEDFLYDNPYMLPYDRDYVVEEMHRLAKKARKKQVS